MLEALCTSIEAVVQLRNHRKHFLTIISVADKGSHGNFALSATVLSASVVSFCVVHCVVITQS